MDVGRRFRHLHRYREIASAFVRYGFGYLVKDLGLAEVVPYRTFWNGQRKGVDKKSLGIRIRLFLEELGPTFVKLGQLAGSRSDLLPGHIVAELRSLQDDVPAFPFSEAARIVETELGDKLEVLFSEFEERPIAAASIGQVHLAVLSSGESVAVKVQRPNIRTIVETDLEILAELAAMAERRLEWAKRYRIREMADELGRALLAELDYGKERRNAEKFAVLGASIPYLHIPAVYSERSTGRILTMERVDGIKLSDKEALQAAGHSPAEIADRFVSIILHQVLFDGFFHADPHPGNALVLEDGRIALLDFGMVGKLSTTMKLYFSSLVIALRGQSTEGVIRAISRLGLIPDNIDQSSLHADVDELRELYYGVPLSQISLGDSIRRLMDVARKHDIRIPSEMTLLGKALLTTEGVASGLDPSFSILKVAEPFGRRLLKYKVNPVRAIKRAGTKLPEIADWLWDAPGKLKELMTLAKQGKIKLELTVPETEAFMKKLDRIGNRLSISIVLLAFSILMVGLIVGSSINSESSITIGRFPAIEIGFAVAGTMLLWLLYSIFRSGR
ncbi:ubiquinone biosynthesis protein [Cohnella thailandensis]|uniref:ABC transporter n=1 Tax=Cohnella thailandensis TaxID=557557 RepID=A0A841SVJ1_9BACL|nr:AarF/UbiB family protein [Cohnella thailandensis]MBB6633637.1 ABC transporter [Cohnella thailandensis]MBP1976422.1 ubiquinone biosynthesis protein [Cohnella thailandensis]